MAALISKPGLTNASAGTVPMAWSPSWFKGFVSNLLQGGDVRNAVGANGIVVSGNIATPYATIGFAAPVSLPGPVTITDATAGTNSLTVSAPGANATSPGSNRAGLFLGRANSYTVEIDGSPTSGQSFGLLINAGTTSADQALTVDNAAGTITYFKVRGDGQVIYQPSSGVAPISLVNGGAATDAFAFGTNYFGTGTALPVFTANKPGSLTSILGWVQVLLNGTVGWMPVWNN